MAATVVTKDTFEAEVLQSQKPVLVDFWATWCGPCKMLSPLVEAISEENDQIKVCSINVDDEPELAMQFKVSAIPTLLAFENGEVINRSVGFVQKPQILGLFQK